MKEKRCKLIKLISHYQAELHKFDCINSKKAYCSVFTEGRVNSKIKELEKYIDEFKKQVEEIDNG